MANLIRYNYLSVILFMLAMILATVLASSSYEFTKHTISNLGGQDYGISWILNGGFIVIGAVLGLGAMSHYMRENLAWYHLTTIGFFAISMMISGVFSSQSFESGSIYDINKETVHMVCLMSAGGALSIAALIHSIQSYSWRLRILNILFFFILFFLLLSLF